MNEKNKKILSIGLITFFLSTQINTSVLASSSKASTYGRIAHDAYSKMDYKKAADYYEKAYKQENIPVYKQNALTAHLNYIYNLSTEENYDKAVQCCIDLFKKYPENIKVKALLSDVYYDRGSEYLYKGKLSLAKSDLEKSIEFNTSEDQRLRAKENLAKLNMVTDSNLIPKQKTYSNTQTTDGSIQDIIGLMEYKIFGKENKKEPLLIRVSFLEKKVYKKEYSNEGLMGRINRLKNDLTPEYTSSSFSPNTTSNDNYIEEIIEQSKGKVNIFGKMPVKVYFSDPKTKNYEKYYKAAAIDGFKMWEKATNGKVQFVITNTPSNADLKVIWSDYFKDYTWTPKLKTADIHTQKKKMKYKKASALVRLGSVAVMLAGAVTGVPIIGSVGAVGSQVASPILQYKGLDLEGNMPDLHITAVFDKKLSAEEREKRIKKIAAHQMGHALGIYGHSPNPSDIMHVNFNSNTLSSRDVNTINEIYKSIK